MAAAAPMTAHDGRRRRSAVSVAPSSIAATAVGRELGELFEYRIAQPVTIRKNESAMLPFLQQKIDGRKLLIYSDHSSQHPTNAAELTNSSGKTLDGGPITVYDARRLRRRSPDGNPQGRRQAADQLRRRPGHPHHRGLRQQGRRGARDPRQPRHRDHQNRRRGDPHLHHPQRGPEGQDPDPRAPAAPRLHAAQPEADGEDRHQLPLRSAARRRRHPGVRGQRRARLRAVHRGDQPHARYAGELRAESIAQRRRPPAVAARSRTRSARSRRTTARCRMSMRRCAA